MKKAKGNINPTGAKTTPVFRIEVEAGDDVSWQLPLHFSATQSARKIPGSLITKVLCQSDVELRLTRFVQPPAEQLGFYAA